MYNRILTLLLLLATLPALSQQRPRVAVVLSGGGARGVAHIGVLRAVEEAGIPVDMVVGTSMGALVGGLYAQGYTAAQLDSLTRSINWAEAMSDRVPGHHKVLVSRLQSSPYIISVPFQKRLSDVVEGGLIKGTNVQALIDRLNKDWPDSVSFDSLPIPFACVATDIATGREVVFHNGRLGQAMRSSMSVPAIFAPVRIDSMVLVDGGLTNNFPVDVARSMGADIVIGSDLHTRLKSADELRTAFNMMSQMLTISVGSKLQQNIGDCDMYVKINTDGYSSTDFKADRIDSLLARGVEAGREALPRLIAMRDSLGIKPVRRTPLPVSTDAAETDGSASIARLAPTQSLISLGAYFDLDESASVLLGLTARLPSQGHPLWATAALKVGKRMYGSCNIHLGLGRRNMLSLGYKLDHNDVDMYKYGKRLFADTHVHGQLELAFTQSYRRAMLAAGASLEHLHFTDLLSPESQNIELSGGHLLNYFLRIYFDNANHRSFPTRGWVWHAQGTLLTTNGARYHAHAPIPAVDGNWQLYFSPTSHLTISPFARGRFVFGQLHEYIATTNLVNTHRGGYYLGCSLPFAGTERLEEAGRGTAIGGISARQRFWKNLYATATANVCFTGYKPAKTFDTTIWGAQLMASYDTAFGPINAGFNWNSRDKNHISFILCAGYKF